MGWPWSSATLPGAQFVVSCLFSVPQPGPRELKRSSRPGSTRTPFFIVSLEHGSVGLEASGWAAILYCWPGSQVQTKHKNENGPSPRTSASNTEGWPVFTRLWPATSRPTSRAGQMQVSKHALYN
jgi:hypothetical protein